MKRIKITYSWHENREFSASEEHTSSFSVEVEDEIFLDCVEQETPYCFSWTKSRRQTHIAKLAFWHAAMHDRFIFQSDRVISVEEVKA